MPLHNRRTTTYSAFPASCQRPTPAYSVDVVGVDAAGDGAGTVAAAGIDSSHPLHVEPSHLTQSDLKTLIA